MNKNRKGFTIVELVIVIAIIAILAAVLIPTFASLIAKANVSVDTQLVRNLNNALTAEKAGGENNKTMYDALMMVKSAGYDIDTIVSKSGNNIAWDSKNDRFVLIDPNNNTYIYPTESGADSYTIATPVDFFVIYNEVPAAQKYSIYLSKNATVTEANVTVGFDAGENTAVSTVNYKNTSAQTVIIRTNGGSLTVSAPNGVVDRYGYCDLLDVQAVKSTSLHEYGTSSMVSINSGRVVFEKENSTDVVFIESNNAIVAVAKDVEIPEVKRAADVTSFKIQTVETNESTVKTTTETVVTISGDTVTTETKDASDQTVDAPANIKVEAVKESAKVEQSKEEIKNITVNFVVTTFEELNQLVSVGVKKITIGDDIEISSVINVSSDLELNLNGRTLTNMVENSRAFTVNHNGVTITVNGTTPNSYMKIPTSNTKSYGFIDITAENVTLIVNGGTFTGNTNVGGFFKPRYSGWNIELNNITAITNYQIIGCKDADGKLVVNNGYYTLTDENAYAGFYLQDKNKNDNEFGVDSGLEAIFENVEIEVFGRSAIEAAGSLVKIKNCKIGNPQNNTAKPYLASAVSVSYGGYVAFDGGNYQGKYASYIFSSGGTITIEGGSFSGGEAVLKADVGDNYQKQDSVINVNGGNFVGNVVITESTKTIGDNTYKAQLNITGGTFSVEIPSQSNIVDNRSK